MKIFYWILLVCLLAGGFVGCSDDEDDYDWLEAFEKEQALIKDFVKDKNATILPFNYSYRGEEIKDFIYVFNYDQGGKKPKEGQFILYEYVQRNFKSQVLDASDVALALGADVTPLYALGGPIYMQMNPDTTKYLDPVSDGLRCISEGGKGEVILSSIAAMSDSYVYRQYEIKKIITEEKFLDYENTLIDKYLDTVSGMEGEPILVPLSEGNDTIAQIGMMKINPAGQEIMATDSVTVYANAYILDEFSTSRQFMKMKEGEKVTWYLPNMISGMEKTMPKLRVGEEAVLLFPSGMAYDSRGLRSQLQYVIPPYSTLLFKVKVISTKQSKKN